MNEREKTNVHKFIVVVGGFVGPCVMTGFLVDVLNVVIGVVGSPPNGVRIPGRKGGVVEESVVRGVVVTDVVFVVFLVDGVEVDGVEVVIGVVGVELVGVVTGVDEGVVTLVVTGGGFVTEQNIKIRCNNYN